ncbi:hypothetical protein BD311DRAFT_611720, partial [Dichomitus squalens]
KAWSETAAIVKEYSDEMVDQWNKEIDGLLTFAALFSAVLTTFNVATYPLLQPAPADQTSAILLQISAQLSSLSISSPFINSTQPSFGALHPASESPPHPHHYVVWLNSLWFTGLVLSLFAATIGIVVKQWLKQYATGLYGHSRQIVRQRQYRLNNLKRWHVRSFVAAIP